MDPLEVLGVVVKKYSDLPWTIGYSGGKDSTIVLHLVVEAAKKFKVKNTVYVIYADTLIEHPLLRKETLNALESLRTYSENELNGVIKTVVLKPAEGEDFISLMVLRGYPAPSHRFRWCMDRLKIKPFRRFIRSIGKHVEVSGVRLKESFERSRNIKKNYNGQYIMQLRNKIVVMPILDWSEQDVFEFLRTHRRWDGKSYLYLLKLYRVKQESSFSCFLPSDVRFGCWVCTVVKDDKMPTSKLLKWARKRILEISRNPRYRVFDSNGKPRSLNKEGRKEIARVFLEVAEREPEALGYDIEKLKDMLRRIILS